MNLRGLIPARAGKTPTSPTNSAAAAAHPRACGENSARAGLLWPRVGSSPRVRGKPFRAASIARLDGLIPARAGKTCKCQTCRVVTTAHPRACGENLIDFPQRSDAAGSSPRVRGKRPDPLAHPVDEGLIPARAGKTACWERTSFQRPAHPRACGENGCGVLGGFGRVGSSPRVRGKPGTDRRERPALGLIPARAGKTRRSLRSSWGLAGSSPRVRGKRRPGRPGSAGCGLIPARAGKT